LLGDADGLARAVETAFFKHIFTRFYARSVGFSYWRGKKDREVDIIADVDGKLVPFEVKYRSPDHTRLAGLKGMVEFCEEHGIDRGYVITRELNDFRTQAIPGARLATLLLNIPAALACYWLGRSEHETAN
jgi:predicted AAA+ superfamily ATPase